MKANWFVLMLENLLDWFGEKLGRSVNYSVWRLRRDSSFRASIRLPKEVPWATKPGEGQIYNRSVRILNPSKIQANEYIQWCEENLDDENTLHLDRWSVHIETHTIVIQHYSAGSGLADKHPSAHTQMHPETHFMIAFKHPEDAVHFRLAFSEDVVVGK